MIYRNYFVFLLNQFRVYRFLDIMPIAITLYNPNTYRFDYVNNHFIKQVGYTNEELVNTKIFDFVHPDELQKTEIEADKVVDPSLLYEPRNFKNHWVHGVNLRKIQMRWLSVGVGKKIFSIVTIGND